MSQRHTNERTYWGNFPIVRIPCVISFSIKDNEWCVAVEDIENRELAFYVDREIVEVDVTPMIEDAKPYVPAVIPGQGVVKCKLWNYTDENTARVEIPGEPLGFGPRFLVPRSAIID